MKIEPGPPPKPSGIIQDVINREQAAFLAGRESVMADPYSAHGCLILGDIRAPENGFVFSTEDPAVKIRFYKPGRVCEMELGQAVRDLGIIADERGLWRESEP